MPKLKPAAKEEANRIIRACIAGNMKLYGVSEEEVSLKARFTIRTFQNKMKEPGTFTLAELQRISVILKFTPLQMAGIMKGKALTSREVREFILL